MCSYVGYQGIFNVSHDTSNALRIGQGAITAYIKPFPYKTPSLTSILSLYIFVICEYIIITLYISNLLTTNKTKL